MKIHNACKPSDASSSMFVRKVSSENKNIEILQHNISYYYRGYDGEMPESDQEHVKEMIVEGYNQGELCMVNDGGTKEYRGWWHIER